MVLRVSRTLARVPATADVSGCRGRRRRECLQEVQRRAFTSQQSAGRADEFADNVVGFSTTTIADVPVDDDVLIKLPKYLVDPRLAAKHERLARNDRGANDRIGIDQGCRKVTGPDVLGKCCRDAGADGGFRFVGKQAGLHGPAVSGSDHAHDHRDGHQRI